MALFSATNQNKSRLDWTVGLLVGGVALLVYLATMVRGFYPGLSATLAAQVTGLTLAPLPDHPLWTLAAQGLLKVFGFSPFLLNSFSAVCGALSVFLFYGLVSRAVFASINQQISMERNAVRASVFAGLFASVALAFSMAVWTASTRFLPYSWDLLLLLLSFTMLGRYLKTSNPGWVAGISFLLGVGIVETPAFIPFAAVIGTWLMSYWIRSPRGFRGSYLAIILIFGILGLCMYLVAGWRFAAANNLADFEYSSFLDVVWKYLLAQFKWARAFFHRNIPWLLVLLFAFVPWLVVLVTASRGLNETRDWVFYVMHIAWTIFTLVVIGNAYGSPWAALATYNRVPVFLQACAAATAGYLVAYWYLLMANRPAGDSRGRQPNVRVGVVLGYVFTVPLMVLIAATVLVNAARSYGPRGDFAGTCAREFIAGLDGRRWVVGDGIFDSHILLEARRMGYDIRLVSFAHDRNPAYLSRLRSYVENDPEFESLDRLRLGNSTQLGSLAFLQDWCADDESIGKKIVMLNTPDILLGSGLTVAPCRLGFVGVRDRESLKDHDFLAEYGPFWDRMEKLLPRTAKNYAPDAADFLRSHLRRQVGFVANNLGVLLEDLDRPEEAFQVYRRVREIDRENASALLNLVEMVVSKGYHPELKDEIQREANDFIENLPAASPSGRSRATSDTCGLRSPSPSWASPGPSPDSPPSR